MKKVFLTFISLISIILVLFTAVYYLRYCKLDLKKSNRELPVTFTTKTKPSNTNILTLSALAQQKKSISPESLNKLSSGTIINTSKLDSAGIKKYFYCEELSQDVKSRIKGKSYKEDCTVPFEDLRYIRILYYGFDKETHIGELIVNTEISKDITAIFYELYKAKYPIERMVLVDDYDADDNASMADNNTSSFNYRVVPGSAHLSKHALGLAIDINPLYNPYIQKNGKKTVILPAEGASYVDRTADCPYYIFKDDVCYKAFIKRDFTWGGSWKTTKDYQHFQKSLD